MTAEFDRRERRWSANHEPLNETEARLDEFDRRLRVLEDILFRATAMAEAKRLALATPDSTGARE